MLKRTSGQYKLTSMVHRMSMKFVSNFLDSLRIKAETLQRNRSVRNVNNIPYTFVGKLCFIRIKLEFN